MDSSPNKRPDQLTIMSALSCMASVALLAFGGVIHSLTVMGIGAGFAAVAVVMVWRSKKKQEILPPKLRRRLAKLIGKENIPQWLETPHTLFEKDGQNLTPAQVLAQGEEYRIWEELKRLEMR